jgi:hypothetical protein
MVAAADGLGDMAFALAARPESEELARKREEMLGIAPIVCGVASVCAWLRG